MKLKVLTNTSGMSDVKLDGVKLDLAIIPPGKNKLATGWEVLKKSFKYDYVIINCDTASMTIQGLLKQLFFWNHCKLVSVDSVLPVPDNLKNKIKCILKSVAFKGGDIFIEYFKDTSGYEKYYHINRKKFRYVPFKINRYQKVLEKLKNNEISDEGYIFCGGNTRRDFDTLIEVARRLGYPVKIVTMNNATIDKHGSHLDESELPANVEVIRHDGSDSFLDYIAKAKLAVLPVKKKNISASGIGVYLACMGLGKCVIISSGPSVDGILKDEAIIVPPEETDELEQAVIKAYTDDEYRAGYEKRAQNYALSLAGEERLYKSILEVLVEDHKSQQNC